MRGSNKGFEDLKEKKIMTEEIEGLKADLLHTDSPPTGSIKLTDWAGANASTLGMVYASELARRGNRIEPYDVL